MNKPRKCQTLLYNPITCLNNDEEVLGAISRQTAESRDRDVICEKISRDGYNAGS